VEKVEGFGGGFGVFDPLVDSGNLWVLIEIYWVVEMR